MSLWTTETCWNLSGAGLGNEPASTPTTSIKVPWSWCWWWVFLCGLCPWAAVFYILLSAALWLFKRLTGVKCWNLHTFFTPADKNVATRLFIRRVEPLNLHGCSRVQKPDNLLPVSIILLYTHLEGCHTWGLRCFSCLSFFISPHICCLFTVLSLEAANLQKSNLTSSNSNNNNNSFLVYFLLLFICGMATLRSGLQCNQSHLSKRCRISKTTNLALFWISLCALKHIFSNYIKLPSPPRISFNPKVKYGVPQGSF